MKCPRNLISHRIENHCIMIERYVPFALSPQDDIVKMVLLYLPVLLHCWAQFLHRLFWDIQRCWIIPRFIWSSQLRISNVLRSEEQRHFESANLTLLLHLFNCFDIARFEFQNLLVLLRQFVVCDSTWDYRKVLRFERARRLSLR
jgi:hypothetical protein